MPQPEAKPHTLPADLAGERLIRPEQLAELCGCSVSQVYRLARAGKFPPPTRVSHRVSGWRAADVLPLIHGAEPRRAA